MKVVAYVRVSTEEQAAHGVSLAAQEAKLRSYCELYDHELTEVIVDAGQSAKSLNRPGLQRALEMLKAGAVQGLLILKLDRLTRSVRDLGELLERYFQNAALISIQEQCDTSSAAGRLVLNVMTSVAQWERETTSERTCAALQYKKAQGVQLGAPALKDEATMARAVALKADGLTLRQVADSLTAEGVPTLKGGQLGGHDSEAPAGPGCEVVTGPTGEEPDLDAIAEKALSILVESFDFPAEEARHRLTLWKSRQQGAR